MSPPIAKGPETKLPLPRLRADLVCSQQTQEGSTFYVLKDPVSLQYMRLARHEFFIAQSLDGTRNIEEIVKLLQEKFSEAEFDSERAPQDVLTFLNQLQEKNFLLLPPDSAVEGVLQRKKDKVKNFFVRIKRNLFYMPIPLFDPDRLLTRMYRPLRFIWTRWFQVLSVLLILWSVLLVAMHFDRLITPTTDFFNWHNLFLLWTAFIGVKVIHEFGHGLTAKHFGGEVHQMGILLLVFTPAFYCDTTDAWMMPKRAHKVWVSSAGIYVELIIAAIAAHVWVFTNEGLINQLALILMFLCSFSTIVFNANPLLRFDGYYMLSDFVEVPNLQQKAYAYVMHLLRRLLFGERAESAQYSQVPLPQKRRAFFAIYSMASYAYRWFILFAIFVFMAQLLAPFGLEALGKMFAVLSLISSMILPVAISGWHFFRARSTKPDPEPLTRPILVCVLLVLGILGATFIPIPQNVSRACVLKPREGYVRAVAPGFLREVRVRDGEEVKAGDIIAILHNPDLAMASAQLESDAASANVRLAHALATHNATQHKLAELERAQAEASLRKVRADLDALTLRAPAGGTVQSSNILKLQDLRGQWFQIGQTFCQVAPTQPLRVIIPLDQREAALVEANDPVRLRSFGSASEKFRGRVTAKPWALITDVRRRELASSSGGDVPTQPDERGVPRPSEALYEAELEIENPDGHLRPGMTGRAKIYCGNTSVAQQILHWYRSLVRFDLQL